MNKPLIEAARTAISEIHSSQAAPQPRLQAIGAFLCLHPEHRHQTAKAAFACMRPTLAMWKDLERRRANVVFLEWRIVAGEDVGSAAQRAGIAAKAPEALLRRTALEMFGLIRNSSSCRSFSELELLYMLRMGHIREERCLLDFWLKATSASLDILDSRLELLAEKIQAAFPKD